MAGDEHSLDWATGRVPVLTVGGLDSPATPWQASEAQGPGPGHRPQVPTSKSKLLPTPLSLGLCRERFALYFPPESCDQLHNPSTSPVLPPRLGSGLHQGEQSSSPPCPAVSRVASCCCVCTSCPSRPQPAADRPRKPGERLLSQAKLFFKFVSLRNQRRPTWVCGRLAVGSGHRAR